MEFAVAVIVAIVLVFFFSFYYIRLVASSLNERKERQYRTKHIPYAALPHTLPNRFLDGGRERSILETVRCTCTRSCVDSTKSTFDATEEERLKRFDKSKKRMRS